MKQQSRKRTDASRAVRPHLETLEAREVPALIGGLDPSFGIAGKFAAFPTTGSIGGVTVDGAGRTVLAGSIPGAGGFDFLVIRLNPNGTLDTTFGAGGKMTVDIAGGDDRARGVATDAAGNVVVAGTTGGAGEQMGFARLRAADGSLDTTFGGGGTGTKAFAPSAGFNNIAANDVLVAPGGGIVATGNSLSAGLKNSLVAVRLTADGSAVDPGFNGGAIKLIAFQFGVGSDNLGEAVVLSGTNIVIGGRTNNGAAGATNQFAAVQLLANGGFDPAFSGGSVVSFNLAPGTSDTAFGVDVDAAGNIYLGGSSNLGAVTKIGVAKVSSTGNLDATFGTGGIVLTQVGTTSDEGDGIAVLPSGKVIVGGTSQVTVSDFDFFALQLQTNGKLDTTFNATGPIPGVDRFDFGTKAADFVGAMTLTPEGRVVIGGSDATAGGARAARLIGTVERPPSAIVGGSLDGRATEFFPNAAGTFGSTPVVTPAGIFPGFTGNVRSTTGDVNGDGFPDAILVTGPGTPIRFAVISGVDGTTVLVPPTAPFVGSETFNGGGFVAAADLDNDGRAEFIFTPDQGGGPRVTIYSLVGTTPTVRANFFGIADAEFRGGARIAAGDINADGFADLAVAAGFQGGPRVELISGATVFTTQARLIPPFFVFPDVLRNGVFVAIGDINGDGFGDLIVGAGPGGGPVLKSFDGKNLLASGAIDANRLGEFFVGGTDSDRSGVRVATVNADGDNKADVAVGTGGGVAARVKVYLGKNFSGLGEPTTSQSLTVFGGTALTDGIFVG